MPVLSKITPCLWFDDRAEEAAKFYTAIFPNSKIVGMNYHGESGKELHQKPVGSVMTVTFELDGQSFVGLNGGPMFKFSEAISFQILCADQQEVDYYWERLLVGEGAQVQACGWLKDQFGVSWQVVPTVLIDMMHDPDPEKVRKVSDVVFQMVKLEIEPLQRAYDS